MSPLPELRFFCIKALPMMPPIRADFPSSSSSSAPIRAMPPIKPLGSSESFCEYISYMELPASMPLFTLSMKPSKSRFSRLLPAPLMALFMAARPSMVFLASPRASSVSSLTALSTLARPTLKYRKEYSDSSLAAVFSATLILDWM